jgi:glutathione S-transferase
VAGDHFSFGDLPLAAAAQRWFNLPIERPATRFVEAWYARVQERPGFKRWVDRPLA